MNWIALKLPFDVKQGEIVMYSPDSGDLVQVSQPKLPVKLMERMPKLTSDLPAKVYTADKVPHKKKKTCVKRPTEKLKHDREQTLSLISQYPAGISALKIAEIIHSRNPNSREKGLAVDDCRWLASQGLVEVYNQPNGTLMGQTCARPK